MTNYTPVNLVMPQRKSYSLFFAAQPNEGPVLFDLLTVTLIRHDEHSRWRFDRMSSDLIDWIANHFRRCLLCHGRIGRQRFVRLLDKSLDDPGIPVRVMPRIYRGQPAPKKTTVHYCHEACYQNGMWLHAKETLNG